MSGDWRTMTLGEFVTLQRGHDLPEERRVAGSIPVLGSFGITGWHNEVRSRGPGVTVGRSGASFGVVSYSPIDFWPLNTALYVINFHGNHPSFAYYFLKNFDFTIFNSGSAQPSLNRNFVHPVEICVPPPSEQGAIANLLGALDSKIELNRRTAETLEAMARALFQSWFVDFDPVHAKAGGRSTELPDAVAALFPDRFGEDGMPEGWHQKALNIGLARSIVRGISPSYSAQGMLVLNQKCIRDGRIDASKARRHDISSKRVSDERLLTPGDVVVNSTGVGTLGRVAQIRRTSEPTTADGHVTIVKPNEQEISANILGLALLRLQPEIETMGRGSTGQTELSRDMLGELEIVIAPRSIRQFFDEIAIPIRERADQAIAEGETLAALRDTLLPRLISGELRIAVAERAVAAVA